VIPFLVASIGPAIASGCAGDSASSGSTSGTYCREIVDSPCAGCSCHLVMRGCDDANEYEVECQDTACTCTVDGVESSVFEGDFCADSTFARATTACDWDLTRTRPASSPLVGCEVNSVPSLDDTACVGAYACSDGASYLVECDAGTCRCAKDDVEQASFADPGFCSAGPRQDNLVDEYCNWQITF